MTIIATIDEAKALRHFYMFTGSNNTQRFTHFLSRLVKEIKIPRAVIIMDNLVIHKTQKVKDIFNDSKNVEALFLPPYTSSLNPIEKYWHVLKDKWR